MYSVFLIFIFTLFDILSYGVYCKLAALKEKGMRTSYFIILNKVTCPHDRYL